MKSIFLFIALLFQTQLAIASMIIDRAVVYFPNDEPPRQDVIVTNPDEEPLYLEVEILEVLNPGTDQEQRNVVRDPEAIGLIATPRRVMVPSGSKRVVRLIYMNGLTDTEQVFRINMTPVTGPIESDEHQMGVKVLIAYQLLAFVEPGEVVQDLKVERKGRTLTLKNNGNVNVVLYKGKQCTDANDEASCQSVKGTRVYPGNETTIELPLDQSVQFTQSSAQENKIVIFD